MLGYDVRLTYSDGRCELAHINAERVSLYTSKRCSWIMANASMMHASQGQFADRVLIEAGTRNATVNESSFYVAISRAREEVAIYTNDKALLPESVGRGYEKSAALDLTEQTDRAKNSELSI